MAKVTVNECSRCNDSWRCHARFSGVDTTRCLRISLAMTIMVSLSRMFWVIHFLAAKNNEVASQWKFLLIWTQLIFGGGILASASMLTLATTPPVHFARPTSSTDLSQLD